MYECVICHNWFDSDYVVCYAEGEGFCCELCHADKEVAQ